MMIAECDADASIRSSTSKKVPSPGQSDKVLTLYPITVQHVPCTKRKKDQPRLRLAFLTDAYLLAEQRFDIQPLRLQDFAQTAQAFNLNLANTFTG